MTTLPQSFWAPEPISPIQFLADLRQVVLERSHARLPKWRFRLADDLVVQIQPRPAERRDRFFLFDCRAVQGAGITVESFSSGQARHEQRLWSLKFGIVAQADMWAIKPRQVSWPQPDAQGAWALRSRVLTELQAEGRFSKLTPGMMLKPSCLICGKALTDPASMARWVGPECFGTSSIVVPRVYAEARSYGARARSPSARGFSRRLRSRSRVVRRSPRSELPAP